MQRIDRLRVVFVLLLSLLGTAALFLPFTFSTSPFDVASEVASAFLKGKLTRESALLLLAAPFFLSIPILIWQVRKLVTDRLTTGEIAAAYVLSTTAMLPIAVGLGVVTFSWVRELPGSRYEFGIGMALAVVLWLLLIANVLLLLRNRRARVSSEPTAEAFLLGGYLPNAIYCLLLFGQFGRRELQIGAYLITVVSIGYLSAIVLLSRQRPNGTSDAVEIPRTQVARS